MLTIFILLFAAHIQTATSSFPKRGLPYNDVSMITKWNGGGSQIQWAYNWDSAMESNFPSHLEYIPMLWSSLPIHTSTWSSNAGSALSRGSGHLLSFNEPDECGPGQACMSPQDAANAYRQYMHPFKTRAQLGAPAITNADKEMTWLKSFFAACQGCQIDFVPVHWYGDASDVTGFKNYMWNAAMLAMDVGADLWITEMFASGSESDQADFLRQVIPFLDHSSVQRYAWFFADPRGYEGSKIVDAGGNPTSLGDVFAYTPFDRGMRYRIDKGWTHLVFGVRRPAFGVCCD